MNASLKREKLGQKIFLAQNPENPKITPWHHFEVFLTQKVGSVATQGSRKALLASRVKKAVFHRETVFSRFCHFLGFLGLG